GVAVWAADRDACSARAAEARGLGVLGAACGAAHRAPIGSRSGDHLPGFLVQLQRYVAGRLLDIGGCADDSEVEAALVVQDDGRDARLGGHPLHLVPEEDLEGLMDDLLGLWRAALQLDGE